MVHFAGIALHSSKNLRKSVGNLYNFATLILKCSILKKNENEAIRMFENVKKYYKIQIHSGGDEG